MERTVAYICNGKASCKKVGCMFAGPLSLKTCSHTTDTRYAKYPISEYPELDFDRFEVEQIKNRDGEVVRELYFEREDYYNDRFNSLQEV